MDVEFRAVLKLDDSDGVVAVSLRLEFGVHRVETGSEDPGDLLGGVLELGGIPHVEEPSTNIDIVDPTVDKDPAGVFRVREESSSGVVFVVGTRFDQVGRAQLASFDPRRSLVVRFVDWLVCQRVTAPMASRDASHPMPLTSPGERHHNLQLRVQLRLGNDPLRLVGVQRDGLLDQGVLPESVRRQCGRKSAAHAKGQGTTGVVFLYSPCQL
jgi:hypothetical protein